MRISPNTPGYISLEDARKHPFPRAINPPTVRLKSAKGQTKLPDGQHAKVFQDVRTGHSTLLVG